MSDAPRASDGYGWSFWLGLAIGWPVVGFGVLGLLSHAGATHPLVFGLFVVGGVLAHDLLLVPVSLAIAVLVGRRVPPQIRGAVTGGLVATGIALLFAYPALRGFGRLSDNPSLLPRDYAFGVAVVVGAIWLVAAVRPTAARLARRRAARRARGGPEG